MTPQASQIGTFGIGVASSILTAGGDIASGKQQQAAYDYNAQITQDNTANEVLAVEQKYSTLVGKQATAYAAAGVDITRGSPLLMMAATAGRGGRQAAQIEEAGSEEANLERYYGKIAAWRGRIGGIGAFLKGLSGAAGTLASSNPYSGSGGDSSSDSPEATGAIT